MDIARKGKKEYDEFMEKIKVISLGGSIIAPDQPDVEFIKKFREIIKDYLEADSDRRLILVVGGGAPAREYQKAGKKILDSIGNNALDRIGIMATRLNAQLVKEVFSPFCEDPVVTDPTANFTFNGRILLAAGWVPGFSTDNDAVLLAERFGAKTVINLSNISKIYSDDPKTNPQAVPLDTLTWGQYKAIVGSIWSPGKNAPFDPVATKRASELDLKLISAGGKDIANIQKILEEKPFEGTTISNA